ncbi:major facilitator superfamily MFS_1 [Catenulispora acidiphila DSM 44928]|uniref:Major facilitator superfamily MFS_1 n=1 Tax=Catenulispora acidiphila (strain DSM 44928 / JCM 14897 / NBRC 102108 / NRRL B-24433 / ID139908) TaxID=479433 RepID=C7Q808_CATAD|nr:MFS transporter [Catenulispora acidiphila]ACU74175.1 major facilitator superfamily MFS_1 [Catenulispora acidiphila DSM 44928]
MPIDDTAAAFTADGADSGTGAAAALAGLGAHPAQPPTGIGIPFADPAAHGSQGIAAQPLSIADPAGTATPFAGQASFTRSPSAEETADFGTPLADPAALASSPAAGPDAPDIPTPTTDPAQLSRRTGWYRYAWGAHAFPTTVTAVFLGPYLTDIARNAAGGTDHYLHLAGLSIRAESFYPFAVTAAALVQAAVLPLVGAVADRSGRTRGLLTAAMTLGVVATLLFYTVTGGAYLWGGALFLTASLSYSTANVLANGYLPTLAAPDERDAISSKGWAVGYLGGAVLLTVNLVVYTAHSSLGLSEAHAARVALASAGLWWLVFGTAGVRRLTAGTSRLPESELSKSGLPKSELSKSERPESGTGYRRLGRTLAALSRNRNALLFLLAYMAYNEGVQTVISFASTYGTKQLDLGQSVMASAILVVQFVAFGGSLWMGRLAARHGTRRTISGSLVAWIVLLAAAFAMTKHAAWQFYLLGCAIGLVLGGTQALSRSLFAQIIPAGQESEYFGLYEVSQNGVAWIGSLTVALAIQFTGSYRLAIVSLVVFFVLGLALLARTDLRAAIRAAGNPVPERL